VSLLNKCTPRSGAEMHQDKYQRPKVGPEGSEARTEVRESLGICQDHGKAQRYTENQGIYTKGDI
jgi:hypothetical protein